MGYTIGTRVYRKVAWPGHFLSGDEIYSGNSTEDEWTGGEQLTTTTSTSSSSTSSTASTTS